MRSSLATVLYGTDEPLPEPVPLHAGPLEMVLERGKLWDLRLGDTEVWHGLGFVYRDADWGTPDPEMESVETHIDSDAFRVECRGHVACAPGRLALRINIEGRNDGCIRFVAEALPETDIETNRAGLCLLHPMSVGGARVAIEHVDGRESLSTFPALVPPWPPFMLIRAIRHEYARNHWARCEFEGDLFELEDQRNNSDASFKTYNRSNLMPRPYWLRAGVPIRQTALLWVERPPTLRSGTQPRAIPVRLREERVLPRVGTQIVASDAALPASAMERLAALRPAHLHLPIDERGIDTDWGRIAHVLGAADCELRLDLVLRDIAAAPGALDALRSRLERARIAPESLAVFPSEQPCLDAARERFPGTRIGGGTHQFFVQLHRAERIGAPDFATFTTSPIVHGTRESEVMLTLQTLPSLVETLRARFPMPMRIGPSTIGARSSPLGRQPSSDGTRRITLARADPRCRGLFGAAWALGYVAQCAKAQVEAVTLMSLTADSGVMEVASPGPPLLHPTYFVLSRLGGVTRMRELAMGDPTRLAGLALCREHGLELLIANLTPETIEVELQDTFTGGEVAIMDAERWHAFSATGDGWEALRTSARGARHTLPAYAVMSSMVHV